MSRLLVTRPPRRAAPLAEELAVRGVEVAALPVTATVWLDTPAPEIARPRWVLFTSMRGVLGVERRMAEGGERLPAGVRVGALASSTAEAVEEKLGRQVDLPAGRSGEELARALLAEDPAPGTVLWPCAERTAGALAELLETAGAELVRWPLYRTVPRPPEMIRREAEARAPWQGVLFAAPSAVQAWAASMERPWSRPCIAIGPTTARALAEAGAGRVFTAQTPDTAGMARAARIALDSSPALNPTERRKSDA